MEGKKFTWVIQNFSELKARSYSDPFVVGGCKWRVLVFPTGNNVNDLSLYLDVVEANSLPYGWRRHAEVLFRVVNQSSEQSSKSKELTTRHWFNASESDWGFPSVIPLAELHAKNSGFLLNNKLIIEVEVDVLEVIGKLDVSEESEMTAESPSKEEGPPVADAPATRPQGDSPSQQEQKSMDASKKDSDGDTRDEDSDHDALPAVSKEGARDTSSLNGLEPLKKASQTVMNGVTECNDAASLAEASNNSYKETQPEKETTDVNGFLVLSSQVKPVRQIFSRHPNIASDFRPKSKHLRTAYMNVLLSLIRTLCVQPLELSEDDLSEAKNSLTDLMDVGFKLDWLNQKLEEVRKRKTKQSHHQALEAELQKLMLRVTELKGQLENEKAETATKGPLSFDDVV